MAEAWRDTFVYEIPAVVCPFCSSPDKIRVRTNTSNGGRSCRLCVCRQCSRCYRVVINPKLLPFPVSGTIPQKPTGHR